MDHGGPQQVGHRRGDAQRAAWIAPNYVIIRIVTIRLMGGLESRTRRTA